MWSRDESENCGIRVGKNLRSYHATPLLGLGYYTSSAWELNMYSFLISAHCWTDLIECSFLGAYVAELVECLNSAAGFVLSPFLLSFLQINIRG